MQKSSKLIQVEKSQIASAKVLIRELRQLIGDLPTLLKTSQGSFIQKWFMRHQWTSIKKDIQTLRCSIESSKSSLSLLLGAVQLEHGKKLLQELIYQKGANKVEHTNQVKRLEAKIAAYQTQMRTERKKTAQLQARYQELLKEQGKKLELSSDTTRAAQEAIDLVKDDLYSAPKSSSSWLRSTRSRRSLTPPSVASLNHQTLERDSHRRVGNDQDSQRIIDTTTEPDVLPIRLPVLKQGRPNQVNDLKPAPLQSGGFNAAGRMADDFDEDGKWIFPVLDADNKRSDTVMREFSARVKDEDGRIIWQEAGSQS